MNDRIESRPSREICQREGRYRLRLSRFRFGSFRSPRASFNAECTGTCTRTRAHLPTCERNPKDKGSLPFSLLNARPSPFARYPIMADKISAARRKQRNTPGQHARSTVLEFSELKLHPPNRPINSTFMRFISITRVSV